MLKHITGALIGVVLTASLTLSAPVSADDGSTPGPPAGSSQGYPGTTDWGTLADQYDWPACKRRNELNCVRWGERTKNGGATFLNYRRGDGIMFRIFLDPGLQKARGWVGVVWPPSPETNIRGIQ